MLVCLNYHPVNLKKKEISAFKYRYKNLKYCLITKDKKIKTVF